MCLKSQKSALQSNENPIYVFPEKELRGLGPNIHILVSMSDLYVYYQDWSTYCIFLQLNRQTDSGNI